LQGLLSQAACDRPRADDGRPSPKVHRFMVAAAANLTMRPRVCWRQHAIAAVEATTVERRRSAWLPSGLTGLFSHSVKGRPASPAFLRAIEVVPMAVQHVNGRTVVRLIRWPPTCRRSFLPGVTASPQRAQAGARLDSGRDSMAESRARNAIGRRSRTRGERPRAWRAGTTTTSARKINGKWHGRRRE